MMRRTIPLAIGFISGILVILQYFWLNPSVATLGGQMVTWRTIVAAFALGLGAINLLQTHLTIIIRRQKNWDASILLIISLVGFSLAGILQGTTSPIYRWGFDYVYQPVFSGIASLLAFTITSASYRAFKVKDWQSSLLMGAGIIVMLGQIGLGALLSESIPSISSWLMDVPNTAGVRGITIGAALGAMAMSLRMLLGLERGYMGGGE
jgi:hypothetical protein